jgi:hypothetical protein
MTVLTERPLRLITPMNPKSGVFLFLQIKLKFRVEASGINILTSFGIETWLKHQDWFRIRIEKKSV